MSCHAAIVGTTASGKSALALALARSDPTIELISVDSMQVYRGMDVGTAKPTAAEQAEVPHHLIDIADPWERFTVARFQDEFRAALADVEARGRRALLVGGTGLYLRAVVDDLAIPGEYPEVRAELEFEPDTAALFATRLSSRRARGMLEKATAQKELPVSRGCRRSCSSIWPRRWASSSRRWKRRGRAGARVAIQASGRVGDGRGGGEEASLGQELRRSCAAYIRLGAKGASLLRTFESGTQLHFQ